MNQIAPETLKQIVNWQWYVNSIQLKDIQFNYKKSKALRQLMGNCIGGGALIYNIGDRQDRMNMPSLSGQLTDQNGQLQVDIRDQRNQKYQSFTRCQYDAGCSAHTAFITQCSII